MIRCAFRRVTSFNYSSLDSEKIKSISFIWLDEILRDCDIQFQQLIKPFQWHFFNSVSSCVLFIEKQLRERRYIFLIASGKLGEELFFTAFCLMQQIFVAYIYCAHLGPNWNWSCDFPKIRGVYNDSKMLINQLKQDYEHLRTSLRITETNWDTESNTSNNNRVKFIFTITRQRNYLQ